MKKAWNKGFTLIELLVVIAVLGILAAVVLVAINPQARIQDARNSGVRSDIGQIGSALEAYFTENNGTYPTGTNLDELTAASQEQLKNVPDAPAGRSADCAVDEGVQYSYLRSGDEVAVFADLEPCGSGASQVWYAYFSQVGKACEVTKAAIGTGDVATPTCD